ncbi:MAG: protein TolR [Xanthomonadaceae bacterium]|nr:protein TolR [Xanthomonadaceae bacterium]
MPAPVTPSIARRRSRRRPLSEINVVPYIDVMLVLLVIFMVTAPLLTQGVVVELPQADAAPLDNKQAEPLIVGIMADGSYHLSIEQEREVSLQEMLTMVAAVMRQRPDTPVLVRGDKNVPYGRVVEAMAHLQRAGVPQVGLMTEPAGR